MSTLSHPSSNNSKAPGINKNNGKACKELKFSEKDEVYTTPTMYNSPDNRGDEYRDSGCFEDDNEAFLEFGKKVDHSPPGGNKVSSKTLEKKAHVLQKRAAQRKPRQHSKSCSASSAFEEEQEASEYTRVMQHLQHSGGISNARMSRVNNNRKNGTGLVWGRPGDELSADIRTALDENDPNYDSELEDSIRLKMVVTPISQKDFERMVTAWVDEYFDHGDVQEVCGLLRELSPTKAQLVQLPALVISMALERKPYHRELGSQLLSAVCDRNGLLNHALMEEAFDIVLTKHLEELTVDVPDAPDMLGCFIARAIADDVIPPKFVDSHKGRVSSDVVIQALRKAENLLHIPHAYAHLDVVWTSSGLRKNGRPTKQLSRAFSLVVKEYMDARDKREVGRTLRELDAPHFLHEFVVQALLLVIERSTEDASNVVVELLDYLHSTGECSDSMIAQGIRRIYTMLSDISLDVPSAYLIMDRFIRQAYTKGFISHALVKEMPRKKRSRFISECVNSPGKSELV
jgi:programmed cell death protein 4